MREVILLSLFLVLGIYFSYYDHKYSKIPNKTLLLGFFLAFIINLIYFDKLIFLNLLISTIIGFLLWKFNIWGAGDGKLFILFSFIIPLEFYPKKYYETLTLLINSFLPLFLFLIILGLFKINKLKFEKISILKIIFSFVSIIGFNYLFNLFNMNGINKIAIIILILFLLKGLYYIIGIAFFIPALLSFEKKLIITSLIIFLIYHIIRFLINNISEVFSKEISVNELKENMIYKGKSLTKVKINNLKKKFKTVEIEDVVHFAKYLFLGSILTILLREDIITFIISLLN
ncbi:A24 family peptidase [Candidatus Woesearchaeota archaeon]|nr:A24 family peptidase [Candidatus Woesearchaeota archaeon]